MQVKRRWSRVLAVILCLQLMLTGFAQTSITYAAEQTKTEIDMQNETESLNKDEGNREQEPTEEEADFF